MSAFQPLSSQPAYDLLAAQYEQYQDLEHLPSITRALLLTLQKIAPCLCERAVDRVCADLGCGPGIFFPAWQAAGFRIIGVDHASRMLEEAAKQVSCDPHDGPKAALRLIQDDLLRVQLPEAVDVAFALFDTVNHLSQAGDFLRFIRSISPQLKEGGLLVFDLITPSYLQMRADCSPFLQHDASHILIWESDFDAELGLSEIFIRQLQQTKAGLFAEEQQTFFERIIPQAEWDEALHEQDLVCVASLEGAILDGRQMLAEGEAWPQASEESDRILYILRKRENK